MCFVLASVITGMSVAVSGLIGFVGLVVPHIVRLLFGPDHRPVTSRECIERRDFSCSCRYDRAYGDHSAGITGGGGDLFYWGALFLFFYSRKKKKRDFSNEQAARYEYMKHAFALESVTFTYAGTFCLSDATIAIPAGAFSFILGPNGAGKSTLFKLMSWCLASRGGCRTIMG